MKHQACVLLAAVYDQGTDVNDVVPDFMITSSRRANEHQPYQIEMLSFRDRKGTMPLY